MMTGKGAVEKRQYWFRRGVDNPNRMRAVSAKAVLFMIGAVLLLNALVWLVAAAFAFSWIGVLVGLAIMLPPGLFVILKVARSKTPPKEQQMEGRHG